VRGALEAFPVVHQLEGIVFRAQNDMSGSTRRDSIELSPLLKESDSQDTFQNGTSRASSPPLTRERSDDEDDRPPASRSERSFELKQLLSLCFVRIVEPIAFCQIFPYVNQYIESLNITDDPSRVGFYSGMVVSAELVSCACFCAS
jgi:hypothetical protein